VPRCDSTLYLADVNRRSILKPRPKKEENQMSRILKINLMREEGAATAEYAIATMAAVAFAGLLVVIMRSPEVKEILLGLIKTALTPQG
jgi:hypothetical protein